MRSSANAGGRGSQSGRGSSGSQSGRGASGLRGPFARIDLHGMSQEEARKTIDRALAAADSTVYQLQLIHGYHRGTSLRSMIQDWYRYDAKVQRIMPGDNPGVTVLVLRELY